MNKKQLQLLIEWCATNGETSGSRLLSPEPVRHVVDTFALFDFIAANSDTSVEEVAHWFNAKQEEMQQSRARYIL